MLIQELQQSIMEDTYCFKYGSKLIFVGEDSYLQKLYIKQIAKKEKAKIIYADNYLEIKKSLTTTTMMEPNKIFVIRNSTDLTSIEIFNHVIPAKNKMLILIFDKIDKRSSFFKETESITCTFEKMTDAQLLHIIRKNYKMFDYLSDDNCYKIINLVNNDYGRLLLELDKLKTLFPILDVECQEGGYDADSNELFEIAINDGLIHQDIDNNVFLLVDAVLNKDYINIHTLHKNAKESDFDVFSLMGLLYTNYKNTLLYKCSKEVNLSSYVKTKINSFQSKYNINELIYKMKVIQDIEQGIKTGKIDNTLADEILLIRLLYE